MKKKYGNYYDINDVLNEYDKYVDINDYMSQYYNNWTETKPSETEEERLAREKAIERNSKINQILGE